MKHTYPVARGELPAMFLHITSRQLIHRIPLAADRALLCAPNGTRHTETHTCVHFRHVSSTRKMVPNLSDPACHDVDNSR